MRKTADGEVTQDVWVEWRQKRVDMIARELPADQWFRLSAGEGMKGPRFNDWASGAFGALTERCRCWR